MLLLVCIGWGNDPPTKIDLNDSNIEMAILTPDGFQPQIIQLTAEVPEVILTYSIMGNDMIITSCSEILEDYTEFVLINRALLVIRHPSDYTESIWQPGNGGDNLWPVSMLA